MVNHPRTQSQVRTERSELTLEPGPLLPDESKKLPVDMTPKTVDVPPLRPVLIDDETIKKGEELQIESLERKNTIAQLLKGHVAINTPGDAMKYGVGMALGAVASHFIGC